jgi:hypothetical protein
MTSNGHSYQRHRGSNSPDIPRHCGFTFHFSPSCQTEVRSSRCPAVSLALRRCASSWQNPAFYAPSSSRLSLPTLRQPLDATSRPTLSFLVSDSKKWPCPSFTLASSLTRRRTSGISSTSQAHMVPSSMAGGSVQQTKAANRANCKIKILSLLARQSLLFTVIAKLPHALSAQPHRQPLYRFMNQNTMVRTRIHPPHLPK